ncbi:MAG: 4'-phosphopantetheinyl transferase superfamily protein [Candidatus Synoicihabitans palmerolidicus]|nr:4'-phosphopantetheinyl transferase superfamily protein [Candidatus Synoicihabitans palmerolidicus]MCC5025743.1 4'-phosphopantetheinyl transferase superfamily protein [Candidatus Synoicihabitans palmerolidicus]MCC5025885.1 4'-phosphopantetheinyl transferase superfamily protein [Candidatus Synoicihabitans palmerolidicus]MCC5025926.1 4'-phosphopantetheinyl transferase superfamily protein [Candidatus Synoicihabitans palmerolidicus]MCC5025965.1 4'-phosphopantetheinyl transferase superfamily prote
MTQTPAAELNTRREVFLHPVEVERWKSAGVPRRQDEFLRGRYAAKLALGAWKPEVPAKAWHVAAGVFGQPVVRDGNDGNGNAGNPLVSITHSGAWAAALAVDEGHPMAVDLECDDPAHAEILRREISTEEWSALARAGVPAERCPTVSWAIREALAKVLRTGLMAPRSFYEIAEVESIPGEPGVRGSYRHFAQYGVQAYWLREFALAVALPQKPALALGNCFTTINLR